RRTTCTDSAPLSLHDALPISRVGRGVQPAARPLLDLGQLVDHALAGEVGAALLRGLRPQQERRGGLHAEQGDLALPGLDQLLVLDRKSTRLNSSHVKISYAVF